MYTYNTVQIFLFVLVFVIIYVIEKINYSNALMFGVVPIIPGLPVNQNQVKTHGPQQKKIKKNK